MKTKSKVISPDFNVLGERTFDERKAYSDKVKIKYPDRVPVIIQKNETLENLPELDNSKYLIPKNFMVNDILALIRKKMQQVKNKEAIFLFIQTANDGFILVPMSYRVDELYRQYVSDDGFLYMKYSLENCFG
jgi:GABA(A) receptor-associated protein